MRLTDLILCLPCLTLTLIINLHLNLRDSSRIIFCSHRSGQYSSCGCWSIRRWEGRSRWKIQKCCDLMWYKFVLHSTSSLSLPLSGGQLGSYDLGNVLIFAVSGAYVLSGFLFVLAAIADDKKIEIEWNADKVKWTYYSCMHPSNVQYSMSLACAALMLSTSVFWKWHDIASVRAHRCTDWQHPCYHHIMNSSSALLLSVCLSVWVELSFASYHVLNNHVCLSSVKCHVMRI